MHGRIFCSVYLAFPSQLLGTSSRAEPRRLTLQIFSNRALRATNALRGCLAEAGGQEEAEGHPHALLHGVDRLLGGTIEGASRGEDGMAERGRASRREENAVDKKSRLCRQISTNTKGGAQASIGCWRSTS